MKTTRAALVLSVLLMTAMAAEPAFAWGRGRVFFGAPFVAGALVGGALIAGYPYYYPSYSPYYRPYYPPYYAPAYYPPGVAPAPTVYVEQGGQPQVQEQQGYWYYCAGSRAYYPYVKDCPAGWQRVAPQPS